MTKASRRPLKAQSPQDQLLANEAGSSDMAGMSAEETARYIAEFTAELAFLARRTNLDLLAYLLDMARLEALRSLPAGDRNR